MSKVDVIMPKMGESVMEGTIIKWHKKEGDSVEKDEIIFEISTDKVDTEVPSPSDGVLSEIKAYEQETVEVETVVAVIETNGEAGAEEVKQKEEKKEEEEAESTTQVGGELVDVIMPKMGESVMEGTIIKWHKKEGDKVEKDEIIFEISTDKVDTEVPSPEDGTIAEILHGENETVEVEEVVARISKSGGVVKKKESKKEEKKEAPKQEAKKEKEEAPAKEEKQQRPAAQQQSKPKGSRFYSPVVMNIAQAEDIGYEELENIEGTGINGRVSKKDVLAYLEDRKSGKVSKQSKKKADTSGSQLLPEGEAPKARTQSGENVEAIPMDNIRKRIMYHMVNSRDTSVHVTAVNEIDMSKVHNYLKANKEKVQEREGVKLTYMSFISYAVIKALKEHPYVNATIDEDNEQILIKKFINLGIAVAVEPNGLIVPNIKSADDMNIKGLAKAIANLSHKSRNKGLMPDDIMDGTFTITNYGVFGSLFGTPIINQPEVGILGVGAVTKKPVVVSVEGQDTIAIKPMMYLSLSHDHRLVDGMLGGLFLNTIKETLENFDTNLV